MRNFFVFLMLLSSFAIKAQNKIDFAGRTLPEDTTVIYSVIVELDNSDAGLGDCNVEMVSRIGSMAIVNANVRQLEELAALPQVVHISVGQDNKLLDEPMAPPTVMELVKTCVDSLDYEPRNPHDNRRMTKVILNLCRRCKAQTAK